MAVVQCPYYCNMRKHFRISDILKCFWNVLKWLQKAHESNQISFCSPPNSYQVIATHDMTALLSWCVQNLVVIWWLSFIIRQYDFSFRFELLTKYHQWNGPQVPYALTYWGQCKMVVFSQTFWNAFSWMKMHEFSLKFHQSLFLTVWLTVFQHWFRSWLGTDQATSHYLNHCWPRLVTYYIFVTWPQWVNSLRPSDTYMRQ